MPQAGAIHKPDLQERGARGGFRLISPSPGWVPGSLGTMEYVTNGRSARLGFGLRTGRELAEVLAADGCVLSNTAALSSGGGAWRW